MRTFRSVQDKVREETDALCRSCYFGCKVEGEVYTRCNREEYPCPEQERIDEIYSRD